MATRPQDYVSDRPWPFDHQHSGRVSWSGTRKQTYLGPHSLCVQDKHVTRVFVLQRMGVDIPHAAVQSILRVKRTGTRCALQIHKGIPQEEELVEEGQREDSMQGLIINELLTSLTSYMDAVTNYDINM